MAKQLIINADDFGIHDSVNRGIYRAFTDGILTSTSLMAGGQRFNEAVAIARDMNGIGIGIHLTLVGGLPPVLPPEEVPTLTWDNGVLCHDYMELIKRDLQHKISIDEVYREWNAQICKVMETGLPVTHIDGHQHLHMWNRFFPVALSLAKRYGIRCMRVPDEKLFYGMHLQNAARAFSRDGLSLMARSHRKTLSRMGIHTNYHFWGMLYGGNFNESRMMEIIGHLQEGVTEFMCHPSADESALDSDFHWGYHGESELRALLSVAIKQKLEKNNVELISYKVLADE